ncbi:MAG: hypothetical protein J3R72DRAFT_201662 [Linnemannia gamsii]|nr:MAG: hypothetical protein J3R72DRAFT_201662 [Linnemannia gamsii]
MKTALISTILSSCFIPSSFHTTITTLIILSKMHFTHTFATALFAALTILSSLSTTTTLAQTPINTILCYQCLEKAAVAITPTCAGLVTSPLSAIVNPFTLTENQKTCYCGLGAASSSWAKTCEGPETCDSSTITEYIQSFAGLKATVCLAVGLGNAIVGGGSNGGGQLVASSVSSSSFKAVAGLVVVTAARALIS